MGNPFCENSSDLRVLDTRDLADKSIADDIHTIENIGQKHMMHMCAKGLLIK